MEYARLAAHFDRLEHTSKRLEIAAIVVDILDELDKEDFRAFALLAQGKVAPDWDGIELGLAEKTVLKVIQQVSGIADPVALYHEVGDLGGAAERALGGGEQGRDDAGTPAAPATKRQATLFGPEPMQVRDVFDRLLAIAKTEGAGSQTKKQQLLGKLLADASPLEARFIIRTVAGRLRLGVADMTFLDALAAWHLGKGVRSVTEMDEAERAEHEDIRRRLERAYDRTSDLALVAATLAADGLAGVDALDITIGVPLRPMAAERCKTIAEILERHSGRSMVEHKYDGLRVQAHIDAGTGPNAPSVRLFSRRMEELTDQFPDVQAALLAAFTGTSAIVEGEVVAMDTATGAMLPFQAVSRRRGRKRGLGGDEAVTTLEGAAGTRSSGEGDITAEVPVAIFLFDLLAVDAADRMAEGYASRRAALVDSFTFGDAVRLSTMRECGDEASVEMAFQEAVNDGAEGIMCKAAEGPYKAGNRGFDWIKFKTDYTAELVDSMDLVVIGAFYGRGRRAGWYGALLMAAYDPDDDIFRSVCKLGTGFDDETLKGLKPRFEDAGLTSAEKPANVDSEMTPDVWIVPEVVMEVEAAEITLSPIHRAAWGRYRDASGLAARFPRFTGRWRDDKGPKDATDIGELGTMYEAQTKK